MNSIFTIQKCRQHILLICFSILCSYPVAIGQFEIAWQKSIGTTFLDSPLSVFRDEADQIILLGKETHEDFAGNLREYLLISKMDEHGNEIYSRYHDVAYNTFNPPIDYGVGRHFYTEEFGDTFLNLTITIGQQILLYKIYDRTGDYAFYETIQSPHVVVDRENEKVYAFQQCSFIQSCYGPDSLVVERFDPSPDSVFNPIEWTFQLKQNIRTQPIQGHYDFDIQDIAIDDEGFIYLLVQIERWDFQFCTDCNDAFIDAYNEVFKFTPEGDLISHRNIRTTKAVVSRMRLVSLDDDFVIAIDDINPAQTEVVTTIFQLNDDLQTVNSFTLDASYSVIRRTNTDELTLFTYIFDPEDPQIHGSTDLLVRQSDMEGHILNTTYLGSTGLEYPVDMTSGLNDQPLLLAHSDGSDFDVESNFGGTDMWLVQLTPATTSVDHEDMYSDVRIYPNPASDRIRLDISGINSVVCINALGITQSLPFYQNNVDISTISAGLYILQGTDIKGNHFTGKFVRL